MQPTTASKTALSTSLMRALHTREGAHRIIDDPWGDRLVPDAVREAIWQRALQDRPTTAPDAPRDAVVDAWLRASPAYASVITRTRYAEDALHAAVVRGCRQYVMIGAGFDSYALRTPLPAAQLAIFEVDHPATQQLKRQCLAAYGQPAREAVHYLEADLAAESLVAVLARSSFDATQPAFFSWLGVTMYLPREANLQALRAIARAGAAGSELVFTYMHQAVFESRAFTESVIAQSVAAIGEPFLSGFHPAELAQDLHGVGFTLLEDLSDTQLVERYDPQGLNQLRSTPFSRVAHARVSAAAARSRGSAAESSTCRPTPMHSPDSPSTSTDPFNLARFVKAQERDHARALSELKAGRKQTHWIWYVLPQLRGLGTSRMSEIYGLSGLAEAQAYLAHPVLGPRLVECVEAISAHRARSAEEILGSVDAMKYRSCLTLFEAAGGGAGSVFAMALELHFAGVRDAHMWQFATGQGEVSGV